MASAVAERTGIASAHAVHHPANPDLADVQSHLGGYTYDEDKPDLDMAGEVAKFVFDNWDDDTWRNAFILALHSFVENMVFFHRFEIQEALDKAAANTVSKARRAIIKAYVTDTLEEVAKADEWDEHAHPRAPRGSDSGGEFISRNEAARIASETVNAYANRVHPNHRERSTQQVEFVVQHSDGKREHYYTTGEVPKLPRGARIVQIRGTGLNRPVVMGDSVFNVAQALGMSADRAGSAGAAAQGLHDTLNQEGWGQRLITGSRNLRYATGADGTPLTPLQAKIRIATGMGTAVGRHGPEVTRVLGPHIRRYSYKYRGTTADPQQMLQLAREGKLPNEDNDAYLHKLTLALARDPARSGGKFDGLNAIPTKQEEALMLKTGHTAPSHGFIVDAHGKVRQQAHGYADDHYVPFNLKDLHALNNGSYTRSRSYGGPTTEDIALAMKTGAHSFETVSQHGIYRVQFTPRINRAGRKIGAWAADTAGDANQIMVNRYGRLLDAIKNGNVRDPENEANTLKLDGRGYEVALHSLQKQFPYFIKSVDYHPAHGAGDDKPAIAELDTKRASHGHEDTGYVRPYYLKPSEAAQGYHDWRLGGPAGSYDELDAYRLGQARKFAKSQRIQSTTAGGNTPTTSVPGVPNNLTPQQRATAEATGGDYGRPVRAYERADDQMESRDDAIHYISYVREFLNNLPHDVHLPPRAQEIRRLANLEDEAAPYSKEEEEWLQFVDAVRDNAPDNAGLGAQEEIRDIMDEIADDKHHGLDSVGPRGNASREAYRNLAGRLWTKSEKEGAAEAPSVSDNPEFSAMSAKQLRESTDAGRKWNTWYALFHPNGRRLAWERAGDGLGQEKRNKLPALQRMAEDWKRTGTLQKYEAPSAQYGGFSERQWFENKMAEADGVPLPHKVSEEAEPTLPKDLASDDEARRRKAEEDWEREILRGLGNQDWS